MYKSVFRLFSLPNAPTSKVNQVFCQKCRNFKVAPFRNYSQQRGDRLREHQKKRIRSTLYYISAVGIVTAGMSYAAVPLYRMFCQAYSYGGTTIQSLDSSKVESMQPNKSRLIKVRFNADKGSNMRWNFKPQQNDISVSLHFFFTNLFKY